MDADGAELSVGDRESLGDATGNGDHGGRAGSALQGGLLCILERTGESGGVGAHETNFDMDEEGAAGEVAWSGGVLQRVQLRVLEGGQDRAEVGS